MRLNAQTDYALRIMMFLAAKQGQPATIQEVATKLQLSQTHMMRIAAKLAACGLVTATRGRMGGLTLGREASLITVEDVVTSIEPDFALVQCFQNDGSNACSIESACQLKGVLASALRAFLGELRAVTLAELTQSNQIHLAEIFRLSDPNYPTKSRPNSGVSISLNAKNGGEYLCPT